MGVVDRPSAGGRLLTRRLILAGAQPGLQGANH